MVHAITLGKQEKGKQQGSGKGIHHKGSDPCLTLFGLLGLGDSVLTLSGFWDRKALYLVRAFSIRLGLRDELRLFHGLGLSKGKGPTGQGVAQF